MVAHGPLAANPILWAKATLRRYRLPDQLRARILFGIAPGGACHAGPVASPPVGSYSTVSPLPMRTWAVSFLWRFPSGCPARALPGTVACWSPDFPRHRCRGHPAFRAWGWVAFELWRGQPVLTAGASGGEFSTFSLQASFYVVFRVGAQRKAANRRLKFN